MSKVFTLNDGSKMTARDIVAKYNVPLGTTRNRLSNGIREIDKLSKQPLSHKRTRLSNSSEPTKYEKEFKPKESMSQRMIYDPLGHWNLINKFT